MPKLTDARAQKAAPGDHSCSETGGFFLRVSKTGSRTWMVRGDLYAPGPRRSKRVFIRQVKKALGRFPEMDVFTARADALAFLKMLRAGEDPSPAHRAVKTLGDAWDAKIEHDTLYNRAPTTIKQFARQKMYVERWLHRPLDSITEADVRALFKEMSTENGLSMANGVLTSIKTVFNMHDVPNPARKVKKHKISREAVEAKQFERKDVPAMWAGLAQDTNPQRAGILRLMYLTGLRFGEARHVRLEHIDFAEHRITIPKTKAGRRFWLPMSAEIEDVVRQAMSHCWPGNAFLFPAHSEEGCLVTTERYNHGFRHFYSSMAGTVVNPLLSELLVGHTVAGIKGVYTHPEIMFPELLEAQRKISKVLMSFTKEAAGVAPEALLV